MLARIACVLFFLTAAFVLATPAAGQATPQATLPAQPKPPASGPGSPNARYPGFRATLIGPAHGGFWLFEPTTGAEAGAPVAAGPLPLILAIRGCCEQTDSGADYAVHYDERDTWWQHMSRQGNIVVLPIYSGETAERSLAESKQALRDALAELAKPGHATPNLTLVGVLGYSWGGPLAIEYAATAATEGLPVPNALFVTAPCDEVVIDGCFRLPARIALPAGIKIVFLVYADDDTVGIDPARRIWARLSPGSASDRAFVILHSDRHGSPMISAGHLAPATRDQFGEDAVDYYAVWKLSDALFACASSGEWCAYAFGDTPEQRFMGVWSDGVPVTGLETTGDLGTLTP